MRGQFKSSSEVIDLAADAGSILDGNGQDHGRER